MDVVLSIDSRPVAINHGINPTVRGRVGTLVGQPYLKDISAEEGDGGVCEGLVASSINHLNIYRGGVRYLCKRPCGHERAELVGGSLRDTQWPSFHSRKDVDEGIAGLNLDSLIGGV